MATFSSSRAGEDRSATTRKEKTTRGRRILVDDEGKKGIVRE
jgi:hypothetical protein